MWIRIIAGCIFFLSTPARAEESSNQNIRAQFSLSLHGGSIADPLPFTLRISFSDDIRIDPAMLTGTDLKPPDIQKEFFEAEFFPYNPPESAVLSPVELKGLIRLYAPGEYVIPPLEIPYTCISCPDQGLRTVKTRSTPLKIGSLIPSGQVRNDLIIPADPPEPDFRIEWYHSNAVHHLIRALLFFLTAALCLLWFLLKLHIARNRQVPETEKLPDARDLGRQLLSFLETAPDPPRWKFMADASGLFREWLAAEFSLGLGPRCGTASVFFEAAESKIPDRFHGEIREILRMADQAAALESAVEADIFIGRTVSLVRTVQNLPDRDQAEL